MWEFFIEYKPLMGHLIERERECEEACSMREERTFGASEGGAEAIGANLN